MKEVTPQTYKNQIALTGLAVAACYLAGWLFPEPFWATQSPGILAPVPRLLVFAIAGGLISSPFWLNASSSFYPPFPKKRLIRHGLFLGIALIGGLLFYFNPLPIDLYGDAVFIKEGIDISIKNWDSRLIMEPLAPDFLNTKAGLYSFYEVNNFFTWLTGWNGTEVTPLIEAFAGALYIWLWLHFTQMHLRSAGWKWLFNIAGLSMPLMVVFMGHYETYYLSYIGILGWMTAISWYAQKRSRGRLLILLLLFPLLIQTHITNWLFLPSLVMVFLWHFEKQFPWHWLTGLEGAVKKVIPRFEGKMTWSGMTLYVFIPFLLVLAYAYFLIYANHDGPRYISKEEFEDNLFLPLYTNEPAPYDRYNLFSLSHFWDYFQLMLMWSGTAVFLLASALLFFRKQVPWNNPLILMTGLSFLLFFITFFVLNPLLGPAIDWDLFCSPGMVAWPLLVILFNHISRKVHWLQLAGPVIGLSVLGSTSLYVFAHNDLLIDYYEHTGKRNFKTYWIGCSTMLTKSLDLLPEEDMRSQRIQRYTEELRPWATDSYDLEYAGLLYHRGMYELPELNSALPYFIQAYSYSPLLGKNVFQLTVGYFEQGNYQKALKYSDELVTMRYPPYKKTLVMGTHIALAAGDYQRAADLAVTYLNRWQDNERIIETEKRLRTGDRVESIIDIFPDQ